jgi:hypothetical protein
MTWFAILKHAPAILAAADALLTRAKSARTGDQRRSIEARLDELEEAARGSATLMQDIARQMHALALAQEAMAKRLRAAIGISVAGLVVALVALVVAIVS